MSEQVRLRNNKVSDNIQKRPRERVKAFHAGDDEKEEAGKERPEGDYEANSTSSVAWIKLSGSSGLITYSGYFERR